MGDIVVFYRWLNKSATVLESFKNFHNHFHSMDQNPLSQRTQMEFTMKVIKIPIFISRFKLI